MADHAHNLRARSWNTDGPVGVPTRGTTGYNRLRKSDRWLAAQPRVQAQLRDAVLREGRAPVAVDVGYGASHTTTVEWARWLRRVEPSVQVTGLEIEPSRVLPPRDGVRFALGGFELAGMRADVIRAFNVLRQYDVDQVYGAWDMMRSRLHPGGVIVEGTCDELGRRCSWVLLDESGPLSLTLAWSPHAVERPSDVAERLPKVLIHNNVPGQPIHEVLQELDRAWARAASFAVFGPAVRWREALRSLREVSGSRFTSPTSSDALPSGTGLPLGLTPRRRLSDCSITLPWSAVS